MLLFTEKKKSSQELNFGTCFNVNSDESFEPFPRRQKASQGFDGAHTYLTHYYSEKVVDALSNS